MGRKVHTDEFLLAIEQLERNSLATHWHSRFLNIYDATIATKETLLCVVALRLNTGTITHQCIYKGRAILLVSHSKELTTWEVDNRVETSRHCDILDALTVYCRVVASLCKVVDIFVWAILLTLRDDGSHRAFTNTLDCRQTEADIALHI